VPVPVAKLGRAAALFVVDLEMETGGDILLRHVPGQPQLGQGANLVGHDLVASCLDGGDDVIHKHAKILPIAFRCLECGC